MDNVQRTPSKIIIGIVDLTKEEKEEKKLFTPKALSILTLIFPSIFEEKKRDKKPTCQQTEEENAKSLFVIH